MKRAFLAIVCVACGGDPGPAKPGTDFPCDQTQCTGTFTLTIESSTGNCAAPAEGIVILDNHGLGGCVVGSKSESADGCVGSGRLTCPDGSSVVIEDRQLAANCDALERTLTENDRLCSGTIVARYTRR